MHFSVLGFIFGKGSYDHFHNKNILEIGSYDVNGSVRKLITQTCSPHDYIGIDMREGPEVDLVLRGELAEHVYGSNSFDTIICLEVLEHVEHWRSFIMSLKRMLRPNGVFYLSTRSKGFPIHEFPGDYWRYEVDDMLDIFHDFKEVLVYSDPEAPGVFVRGSKPMDWKEDLVDLNKIEVKPVQ